MRYPKGRKKGRPIPALWEEQYWPKAWGMIRADSVIRTLPTREFVLEEGIVFAYGERIDLLWLTATPADSM